MSQPAIKYKEIEFSDIQTLARFGCGHLKESCLLLLSIKDTRAAGSWLHATNIESATYQETLPNAITQICFSVAGLRTLGLADDALAQFSDEFLQGMDGSGNRSRRLGDINTNAPQHWVWGHQDIEQLHVLLLLYAREANLDAHKSAVLNSSFHDAFTIKHTLPTVALVPTEPFGFIDGISQPAIDWKQTQSTDTHDRDTYSNSLAPGEVVLGYNNEYGQLTARPHIDPSQDSNARLLPKAPENPLLHDFGANGSYLVIRQLEQHVTRFWNFINEQTENDSQATEQLAASMIGRHRDGTPLINASDINSSPRDFTFDNDPHGLQCPIGSHIRRSNPRSGDFPPNVGGWFRRLVKSLGFKRQHEYDDLVASSRFHRLLRRGRTYDNGLHFICLTGNIGRQFEFVQSAWSASSTFAGLKQQQDPLLGNRQARISGATTDEFTQPSTEGAARKTVGLPEFVTVRGGGYFFMPGLRAIEYLARISAPEKSHQDTEMQNNAPRTGNQNRQPG